MMNVVILSPIITLKCLSIRFYMKKIFFPHLILSVERVWRKELFVNIYVIPGL